APSGFGGAVVEPKQAKNFAVSSYQSIGGHGAERASITGSRMGSRAMKPCWAAICEISVRRSCSCTVNAVVTIGTARSDRCRTPFDGSHRYGYRLPSSLSEGGRVSDVPPSPGVRSAGSGVLGYASGPPLGGSGSGTPTRLSALASVLSLLAA